MEPQGILDAGSVPSPPNLLALHNFSDQNITFSTHFETCVLYTAISINVVGSKLKDIFKEATTSSIWYPNISFV